jgi:hypothetical protein
VARRVAPQLAEKIVRAIEKHPDGASIEHLADALDKVPRRTLQRRLSELVTSGRLRAIGRGKQRRYQLAAPAGPRPEELTPSPTGQEVRELVRRPRLQRTPVGYVATFLERYRPNRHFYLDPATRSRLQDLGRAPGAERPAGTYARQILSRLLVDLSWASSRLEGNTYTRLDTQNQAAIEMLVSSRSRT